MEFVGKYFRENRCKSCEAHSVYTFVYFKLTAWFVLNHPVKLLMYQRELQASLATHWICKLTFSNGRLSDWLTVYRTYRVIGYSNCGTGSQCIVRSVDGGINYAADPGPVQCSPVHRPINSENIHEPRNPSGRCVIPEGGQGCERRGGVARRVADASLRNLNEKTITQINVYKYPNRCWDSARGQWHFSRKCREAEFLELRFG